MSNRFSLLAALFPPEVYALSCIYETPTKSEHFHISITLSGKNKSKDITAMIDSGVSTVFINKKFVEKHGIQTWKLIKPIEVLNIDGTRNRAGFIMKMAIVTMAVGGYKEKTVFTVTDYGLKDIIIGIDWLHYHNLYIDWFKELIMMDGCSDDCLAKENLI